MHSDSESYAPSSVGSTDTPQVATPPLEKRRMQVEVVIPIPVVQKRKTRNSRRAAGVASPARSDSSISLGTNWHISPKRRRIRRKKSSGPNSAELALSKGKRPMNDKAGGNASVRFQSAQHTTDTTRQSENTIYPRPGALRVNLESARLDHILAQERGRDYNYNLFTPPSSGDTATQDVDDRISRGSPLSRTGSQLYALATGNAGSSTGPGTQGWLKARSAGPESQTHLSNLQRRTASAFPPSPPRVSVGRSTTSQAGAFTAPRKEHISAPSPSMEQSPSLPNVSFTDPDYDHWARVGLRVALEELVDCYGFPMDVVEKVYESKGNVEETDRFLGKWKNYMMEDAMNDLEM